MKKAFRLNRSSISDALRAAQKSVEGQHFESRKHFSNRRRENKNSARRNGLRRRFAEGMAQKDLI